MLGTIKGKDESMEDGVYENEFTGERYIIWRCGNGYVVIDDADHGRWVMVSAADAEVAYKKFALVEKTR